MAVDRRFFLFGPALAAHAFQSEKPVNTAMIGTGNRGSFLLQGVLRQPAAKVLALRDIKPDRLDKAASAAAKDNPATYSDCQKVIERKDVDAVFIATPPYLHSEMAIQAIKTGKHVYCKKPLGVTASQVRALLDADKGSNKVFVAGQQLRSQKQLGETVRKISEGVIGDVTKSGGYLIEQSVHNLDLCNWVIGSHPLRACGFGAIVLYKNDPPGRTIFDCGSITYDDPNGVKMSFTQNVFHPASMPHGNQYAYVYGSKGAVDLMTGTMYPAGGSVQPVVLAPKQREDEFVHIAAFYESIVNGAPPPVDIKGGATAALTAILGHEAMVQERVVKWSDFSIDL
jgi:myo-inositol 2-dehydrogenase/D-chiro-inositol 1-dehydrogenase